MIDTFFKVIHHSYSFDNEMIIKMNDTYDRYFFHYVVFNSNPYGLVMNNAITFKELDGILP